MVSGRHGPLDDVVLHPKLLSVLEAGPITFRIT